MKNIILVLSLVFMLACGLESEFANMPYSNKVLVYESDNITIYRVTEYSGNNYITYYIDSCDNVLREEDVFSFL